MQIQTSRFGTIEIDEQQIITMPNGLLGFSSSRLYTLLEDDIGSPFKWFQSVENEALAFVTIDPQLVVSNYTIAVSEEHLKKLQTADVTELMVLVIVTMTKDIKNVTINLQGPLVVNREKRIGLQLVIPDGVYSTRHPLFGDKLQYMPEEKKIVPQETKKMAVG